MYLCSSLQTLNNEQLFYTDWWKRIPKRSKSKPARQITDKVMTTSIKLFSDDDDDEDEKSAAQKSGDQCVETRLDTKDKSEKEANMKELSQIANLFERITILGNFESAKSVGIALLFQFVVQMIGFLFVILHLYLQNQPVALPGEETSDQSFDSFCDSQLSHDIADTIKTQIFSERCNTDSSFSFREYYRKIR